MCTIFTVKMDAAYETSKGGRNPWTILCGEWATGCVIEFVLWHCRCLQHSTACYLGLPMEVTTGVINLILLTFVLRQTINIIKVIYMSAMHRQHKKRAANADTWNQNVWDMNIKLNLSWKLFCIEECWLVILSVGPTWDKNSVLFDEACQCPQWHFLWQYCLP